MVGKVLKHRNRHSGFIEVINKNIFIKSHFLSFLIFFNSTIEPISYFSIRITHINKITLKENNFPNLNNKNFIKFFKFNFKKIKKVNLKKNPKEFLFKQFHSNCISLIKKCFN